MSLVNEQLESFLDKARLGQKVPNDAASYGVDVEHVSDHGQPHWRVIGIHHLTGAENMGNHNVFCDVLDTAGSRIQGAHVIATNHDLPPVLVRIDKPPHEPGANFPMFKNDTFSLAVYGPDEAPLPSDRVINLHSRHPDEGPGNTLFHHSFFVVFQKTTGISAPVSTLEDTLWDEGQPLLMPLNYESGLYKFAAEHGLGERLTREYVVEFSGLRYLAQIFEKGLVFAPVGQWDQIKILVR